MKFRILSLFVFLLCASGLMAQAPQGINYQAVARDTGGVPLKTKPVSLRISILDGSATGSAVYQESHSLTTNKFGLFTLVIGKGSAGIGTFSKVDWGTGDKYLKIEMDATGGTNYTFLGTSQLVSVPYALYAAKAGNPMVAGKGISINGDTIKNTAIPAYKAGKGIALKGDTIQNTAIPSYKAGRGIALKGDTILNIAGNYFKPGKGISFNGDTIVNTAPDQKLVLTGGGSTVVGGTYPNFTINTSDSTMWKRKGAAGIYHLGNVGLNSSNPLTSMDVNGMGIFRSQKYTPLVGIGNHLRIGFDSSFGSGYLSSAHPTKGWQSMNIDGNPLRLNTGMKNAGDIYMLEGDGKLGIGTITPAVKVHIYDTTELIFRVESVGNVKPHSARIQAVRGSGASAVLTEMVSGDGICAVGSQTSTPMFFMTGGKIRMFLDTMGRIGINHTTPSSLLHIVGPITSNKLEVLDLDVLSFLTSANAANSHFIKCSDVGGSITQFIVKGNGNVGIGTGSPTQKLTVAGNICYTGSIGSCSDLRYKTNIQNLTSGSNTKLMKLRPVSYSWRIKEFPEKNFTTTNQFGFIAQEVEKLYPELVITDPDGYKSVDYVKLTPLLVNFVQEQQKEIEALKKQNNQILERLNSLENKSGNGNTHD